MNRKGNGNDNPDKHIIGLVGGIASGKTTVARMMEEEGAVRVDADELAGEALEQEEIQERIRTEFGPEVVSNGTVNRSMLAEVVFQDETSMKTLNGLIHPYVLDRIREKMRAFRADGEETILVLDVPLLVETDLDEACDVIVFLDAPEAERRRRTAGDRGWSADEFRRRESFQADLDLKRKIADCRIDTTQSEEATRKRVRTILSELDSSSSGERD